jgi:peptidoglycan-associated lipoprotein
MFNQEKMRSTMQREPSATRHAMGRYAVLVALVATLGACKSTVKEDLAPIESRSGSARGAEGAVAGSSSAGDSGQGDLAGRGTGDAGSTPGGSAGSGPYGSAGSAGGVGSAGNMGGSTGATGGLAVGAAAPGRDRSRDATLPAEKTIYFSYDSFTISDNHRAIVDAHARALLNDSNRRVTIQGHTDERGSREYNLALGQKRAEAVKQSLASKGVQPTQIEAISFGEEKPQVEGTSEAAFSKNRRAELVYP